MKFFVYILFSSSLQKFYVGSTESVEKRIKEHNRGKSNFTSKGIPWEVIKIFELESRAESVQLERKIKKRGIARYLFDKEISLPESSGRSAAR